MYLQEVYCRAWKEYKALIGLHPAAAICAFVSSLIVVPVLNFFFFGREVMSQEIHLAIIAAFGGPFIVGVIGYSLMVLATPAKILADERAVANAARQAADSLTRVRAVPVRAVMYLADTHNISRSGSGSVRVDNYLHVTFTFEIQNHSTEPVGIRCPKLLFTNGRYEDLLDNPVQHLGWHCGIREGGVGANDIFHSLSHVRELKKLMAYELTASASVSMSRLSYDQIKRNQRRLLARAIIDVMGQKRLIVTMEPELKTLKTPQQ